MPFSDESQMKFDGAILAEEKLKKGGATDSVDEITNIMESDLKLHEKTSTKSHGVVMVSPHNPVNASIPAPSYPVNASAQGPVHPMTPLTNVDAANISAGPEPTNLEYGSAYSAYVANPAAQIFFKKPDPVKSPNDTLAPRLTPAHLQPCVTAAHRKTMETGTSPDHSHTPLRLPIPALPAKKLHELLKDVIFMHMVNEGEDGLETWASSDIADQFGRILLHKEVAEVRDIRKNQATPETRRELRDLKKIRVWNRVLTRAKVTQRMRAKRAEMMRMERAEMEIESGGMESVGLMDGADGGMEID